jgi:hypothetical protein
MMNQWLWDRISNATYHNWTPSIVLKVLKTEMLSLCAWSPAYRSPTCLLLFQGRQAQDRLSLWAFSPLMVDRMRRYLSTPQATWRSTQTMVWREGSKRNGWVTYPDFLTGSWSLQEEAVTVHHFLCGTMTDKCGDYTQKRNSKCNQEELSLTSFTTLSGFPHFVHSLAHLKCRKQTSLLLLLLLLLILLLSV